MTTNRLLNRETHRGVPVRSANLREHLESPRTQAALRIQQGMLTSARDYLVHRGFVELLPPIIGPVTDPGARGAKQVDVDFYGHRYKLMTSAILYKQASLTAFDKLFYIAPNIRLESPESASTSRHLAEFHQIDVEIAGATRDQAMRVAEDLVVHVLRDVIVSRSSHLAALGRNCDRLARAVAGPFGRYTHTAAVEHLHELGHDQHHGTEIDWQAESLISQANERPFFITEYPKGSRGFYDRENCEQPGVLQSFDLLAPEGYGELCSGSERENEYSKIVTRIRETGENPSKYGWYVDLAREGIPPSAGFGLGLERFTRYVAGLHSVWQASAYPKVPGVASP
ncbi:asparagine synthetase A [Streptomyces sp. NPDC021218]|uniref:asparagine synthetase A n=1 Tax=Streptomyces sp. NPDC021218 TaxID=3365119 RepID=UPI00378CA6A4